MDTSDKMNISTVKTTLSSLEDVLSNLNSQISNVVEVGDALKNAWSSTNADLVKSCVTKIQEDLSLLYSSVSNIKTKVNNVASNIEKADEVSINGGSMQTGLNNQNSRSNSLY